MAQNFEATLMVGGKSNSLGLAAQVISQVLQDQSLLDELYQCMFSHDAWVRMRAADAFEKVCREHPDWIEPYIDRLQRELAGPEQQASIQWHLAQIYPQVTLTAKQKQHALTWLRTTLSSPTIDWIVAANCMQALAFFTKNGDFSQKALLDLLKIQQHHASKSVVKKANKIAEEFMSR